MTGTVPQTKSDLVALRDDITYFAETWNRHEFDRPRISLISNTLHRQVKFKVSLLCLYKDRVATPTFYTSLSIKLLQTSTVASLRKHRIIILLRRHQDAYVSFDISQIWITRQMAAPDDCQTWLRITGSRTS